MQAELFYYDITKHKSERELNFITTSLIKSKLKLGFDKDSSLSDDTIVYTANLLFNFSRPNFIAETKSLIKNNDVEIFKAAESMNENSKKYFLYKANADHILAFIGLFRNITDDKQSRASHYPVKHYINRGKIYYETAQDYLHKIYRKKTALFDIYEKMSLNFEKYISLLTETRRDYFSFLKDKDSSFVKFVENINQMEENILWQKKQDELLDLYSKWRDNKTQKSHDQLYQLATELQIINREFKFQVPA